MLDVVMASAAVSAVDFVKTVVTLNLDTCFVEPGRGRLMADGEVVRSDDTVVWCRAHISDAEGRLVAKAHGSFRYLPRPYAVAAKDSA
jgi:acyl-coenzyme A thioesterase PaaI-like protein